MADIESIQVRGLRASGTNYMDNLMAANYPQAHVIRTLFGAGQDDYGWKHGALGSELHEYVDERYLITEGDAYVRYENDQEVYRVKRDDPRYVGRDAEGDVFVRNNVVPVTGRSLLVVVHRNPLKWLQSVHRQPHHAPGSYDLSMGEFIRSPWQTCYTSPYADASPDPKERQEWLDKAARIGQSAVENEISIFMHRARSIMLFELLREQAPNVVYVNYEQLREHPQTSLGRIAMMFDIPLRYGNFKDAKTYKGNGKLPYIEQDYPPIEKPDLLRIMRSIDWNVEATIGYEPIRDFSRETDPESIPDSARKNPTHLIRFNPRTRVYRSV